MKFPIHPKDALLSAIPGTLPRKPGKPRKPQWRSRVLGSMVEGEDGIFRPAPVKEKDIRAQVVEYLDVTHPQHYFTLPDELMRVLFAPSSPIPPHTARMLKTYLAHWPDFTLYHRVPGERYARTLFLELKTMAGQLSKGQRLAAHALGYVVVRSFEEARREIDEFYA